MRPEQRLPRRGRQPSTASRRVRVLAAIVVAVVLILLLSIRGIANFITDFLWFDAVGFNTVWSTMLWNRVVLAAIFVALFVALAWINLRLADMLAPTYREPSPEEEAVARFREAVGERWGLLRLGVAGLFGISIGANAATQWSNWLLFRNGGDFGQVDPQFGRDIGFFVFRLPFLSWLVNWFFTALLVILVLSAAMHYLAGGIRVQSLDERVTPQVKAHLSVLLAGLALVRAIGYWLDRFALSYSYDGKFAGLSYTDVNARLPVLNLLMLIAILSIVLFVVNIRRRGWGLPVVAVGLWALVSIVMGGIYPVVVQRFVVNPVETEREAPFISRNIAATKEAFGLGEADIDQRGFDYSDQLTGADLEANQDNLRAVPLLDPRVSAQTFELQQVERSFFGFDDDRIDIDRYVIDDELTQVLVGARELDISGVPANLRGWESEVLSFTHGNGITVAPANDARDSLPVFLIGDVPIENQIEDDIPIEQPRIYYGENMGNYAIVDTERDEVDSIDGGTRVPYNYTGNGGVDAGGFWRRAMFSLRFQSIDPLLSDFVRNDSRFIWNRNVWGRVAKVAPFLELDHNPYPTVVDGRIKWVLDAYTTSPNYPYSQPQIRTGLDSGGHLNRHRFNYVRGSVKAVVDAYDGSVELYVVDSEDPIAEAWRRVFPDLLRPFDEMPSALVDNLRYPEDLFTVQTNMWQKYHIDVDETADLLEGSDEWAVAQDPGGVQGAEDELSTAPDGTRISGAEVRVPPYYTVMRLPDESSQQFVIFRSFVPFSANDAVKEMSAFMVGVSEPRSDSYGRLVSYEVANTDGETEAPAPALVASGITSQDRISERISLLNAKDEGSSVQFGDLIVLPVEDSIIYVRPMYVIATGTRQPNLEWVIVSHADNVVMCHGLAESVRALFGVEVDGVQRADDAECLGDIQTFSTRPSRTGPSGAIEVEVGDGPALDEALRLLDEADLALVDGDLGRYQALVDAARNLLADEIDALLDADEDLSEGDAADDADG